MRSSAVVAGVFLGAFCGLAASIVVLFACSASVGTPSDLDSAVLLALGTVVGGAALGGIVGAILACNLGGPRRDEQ